MTHDPRATAPATVPPGRLTTFALGGLLAATLLVGAAYAATLLAGTMPGWAPWAMALAVPAAIMSTMVLGASRNGRLAPVLAWPVALVGAMLLGGFLLALGLPADEGPGARLFLGLPLRAAVIVYGIGLLPVVILPVAYALTFEALTLRPEDLERVRRAGAAWKAAQVMRDAPAAREAA